MSWEFDEEDQICMYCHWFYYTPDVDDEHEFQHLVKFEEFNDDEIKLLREAMERKADGVCLLHKKIVDETDSCNGWEP